VVKRVVLSWWSRGRKGGEDFRRSATIHKMHLWLLSVCWARKWFDDVILMADDEGRALLADHLQMPFTGYATLPPMPEELGDIYALGKLAAHIWAADQGEPYVVIDHDAWFTRRPPERMLRAATLGQQWGPVVPASREINARLARPFALGERKVLGAILGGCDVAALGSWARRSLAEALAPENRAYLKTLKRSAGFCAASLIEEAAFGAAFPDTEVVGATAEDARAAGYMHLAGAKDQHASMALVELRLLALWPAQKAEMEFRWQAMA
jgi:hypothetical protein